MAPPSRPETDREAAPAGAMAPGAGGAVGPAGGAGAPGGIRALDLLDRPRLSYDGFAVNVLDVRADHVTIRGLRIGPTHRNIDGIRVFSRAGVTVEDCEFSGLRGI